jgi:hypothetical protein
MILGQILFEEYFFKKEVFINTYLSKNNSHI